MAKNSKSKKPEIVRCVRCGKTLKAEGSITTGEGSLCAKHLTPKRIEMPVEPKGYLKVEALARKLESLRKSGKNVPSINRMVTCLGRDCGYNAPIHPICTPVYVRRVRYVHPWLFTEAGMKAMLTSDFAKAPKGPYEWEPKVEKVMTEA